MLVWNPHSQVKWNGVNVASRGTGWGMKNPGGILQVGTVCVWQPLPCGVAVFSFRLPLYSLFFSIYTVKDVLHITQKSPALRNLLGIDWVN